MLQEENQEIGRYNLLMFFPSHIHLEESTGFLFDYMGKRVNISPVRHTKSLFINDFNNTIITTPDNKIVLKNSDFSFSESTVRVHFKEAEYFYAVDAYDRDYREFYYSFYTEVIVVFETTKTQDNLAFAIKALEYFIECYRAISNDIITLPYGRYFHLGQVLKEAFTPYEEEDLNKSADERLMAAKGMNFGIKQIKFPNYNTYGKTFETDPKTNTTQLKEFFKENKNIEPLARFILTAREELYIHSNFKISLLESWISIEMSIVQILNKIKLEKGISKNKISDFASKIGISYLLNIELPLIFSGNDESFKQLINRVDSVRKLRNKVIHENKEVSQDEAIVALTAAIDLLNYLGYKKINT